jgi:FMN phosphatase YigB (HAD superfamily)
MEQALHEIQGIIFELDSVLFDKADWVIPATEYAAAQMRIDPQRAVKLAHDYIAKHGGADPQIYNFILLGCGQFDTAMNIRAFTSLVNQFQPASRSIQLYPGVEEALLELRDQYKLGVVTDGTPDTQKRKVMALGLHELIPLLVYSDEIEGIKSRLPDPRPLLKATGEMRLRPNQVMFVGHNPVKHFMRTGEMGFITVRVLSGEYGRQDYMSEDHRADFDLPSVARLVELLRTGRVNPVYAEPEWGTETSWAAPELASAAPQHEWKPEDVPTGTSFEDAAFQALFQLTDPLRAQPPAVATPAPAPPPVAEQVPPPALAAEPAPGPVPAAPQPAPSAFPDALAQPAPVLQAEPEPRPVPVPEPGLSIPPVLETLEAPPVPPAAAQSQAPVATWPPPPDPSQPAPAVPPAVPPSPVPEQPQPLGFDVLAPAVAVPSPALASGSFWSAALGGSPDPLAAEPAAAVAPVPALPAAHDPLSPRTAADDSSPELAPALSQVPFIQAEAPLQAAAAVASVPAQLPAEPLSAPVHQTAAAIPDASESAAMEPLSQTDTTSTTQQPGSFVDVITQPLPAPAPRPSAPSAPKTQVPEDPDVPVVLDFSTM